MAAQAKLSDLGSLPRLISSVGARFGHPSRRSRWAVFAVATIGGWVALALWTAAQHGHFDDEGGDGSSVWWLMLICTPVGVGQGLAQFVGPAAARGGKKRPVLLRWWQVVLLIATHIAVTSAITATVTSSHLYATMDLLFFGTMGWAIGPLAVLVAALLVLVVVTFAVLGILGLRQAMRTPHGPPRAKLISNSIAALGMAVALPTLGAAIPWLGMSPPHGRSAATVILAAVILFLQAVHVISARGGMWLAIDRVAYLVGVAALAQAAVFRLVPRLAGRPRSAE